MSLLNSLQHLQQRFCPVCRSEDQRRVRFEENIVGAKLNHLAYSSRKMPEFMNFRLICCPTCDLLYASPVPTNDFLETAYHATGYDSNEEAHFAAKTYAKWLNTILPSLSDQHSALEIGTGNGAFLQHLISCGFKEVIGVEPSIEAISAASEEVQKHIYHGMFDVNQFSFNHFSLITVFQTLEHIQNPLQFFVDSFCLLKPGGMLLMVTHNYRQWLMQLLGKKSPIIDIEHLQLFSPKSLNFVLEKTGFRNTQIHALRNVYPFHYWIKLLPLSSRVKTPILNFLKKGYGRQIGQINIGFKVGNLISWAYKPLK